MHRSSTSSEAGTRDELPLEHEDDVPAWSPQAVAELRVRHPEPFSPWAALAWQACAGLLLMLVWAGLGSELTSALPSVAWGALVVLAPGLVMARGMGRKPGPTPQMVLASFIRWEAAKVLLGLALLLAAPLVLPKLHGLALLSTMVVCLKVYGVVLLAQAWRRRSAVNNAQP